MTPTTLVRHLLQSARRQLRIALRRLECGTGDGDLRPPLVFSACLLGWEQRLAAAAAGQAVRSKPWLFEATLDAFARDLKRRVALLDPLDGFDTRIDEIVARVPSQTDWSGYSRRGMVDALRSVLEVSVQRGKHLQRWMINLRGLLAERPVIAPPPPGPIGGGVIRSWSRVLGQPVTVASLQKRVQSGYYDRPIILHGPDGTGKSALCRLFAKAALCKHSTTGDPCNACDDCRAFDAGSTMGFIPPVDASRQDARSLFAQVLAKAKVSGIRGRLVGVIDRIDQCQGPVADMLLKTIEEPPSDMCLILLTSNLDQVRPGIRSRSEKLGVNPLDVKSSIALTERRLIQRGLTVDASIARLVALLGEGLPAKLHQLVDRLPNRVDIELDTVQRLLGSGWARELPSILEAALSTIYVSSNTARVNGTDTILLQRSLAGLTLLFGDRRASASASPMGKAAFLGLGTAEKRRLRQRTQRVAAAHDLDIDALWKKLALTLLHSPGS